MEPVTIAVIGAGHMGRLHAVKLAAMPEARLTAVVDIDRDRAQSVAGETRCAAFDDYRNAIDDAEAVIIAVPTERHHEVLHACLERGKHALVEKPIASNAHDAEDLVALAQREQLVLQVAHIERFNASFQAMASRFTRPLFIDAERLAGFKRRGVDVDVILDLMIHDIDLTLSLVRADVSHVSACGFRVLTNGIDIANAYIEFADGCVANLSASRVSQAPVRKLRVFQHNLYASADLQAGQLKCVRRREGRIEQDDETLDGGDALTAQARAFVAAVRGEPVAVTGDDGRRALELALRVGELARERLRRMAVA
ncbi:MAG TPA: Gfo/Idh/MocA family oxidoreductase [Casimicrobiaceae bacterium]|nr:Gfo/Idh/MocA family oxidoreductase [Casimicrobiaceae bacterium]